MDNRLCSSSFIYDEGAINSNNTISNMIKVDQNSINPINRASKITCKCERCASIMTVHVTGGFNVNDQGQCCDEGIIEDLMKDLCCEACGGKF